MLNQPQRSDICGVGLEVEMVGRRSHSRLTMAQPWDGALEVLRDVVIDHAAANELVAISNIPAVVGEEMSLDLMSAGVTVAMRVRVLTCRPVMVDGSMRHQLHLGVVTVPQFSAEPGAAEV
jgi:hypothetical protein